MDKKKDADIHAKLLKAAHIVFPSIPPVTLQQYVTYIMKKYPNYDEKQWHDFAQQMYQMVQNGSFAKVVARAKMRNNAAKQMKQGQPSAGAPQAISGPAPAPGQTPGAQ